MPSGAIVVRCLAGSALVLQRIYLAARAPGPGIFGDEAGVWAVARFLAQRSPNIAMFNNPPYSVVAGALLAPVARLIDGQVPQYRAFLAVATVLAIGGAAAGAHLVHDLFRVDKLTQAMVFAFVVLYPATVLSASFSWVEFATPIYILITATAFVKAITSPTTSNWVLAGVLAGTAPALHGRFLAIPIIFIFVAIARAFSRDKCTRTLDVRSRVLAVGTMALVLLVWQLLSQVAQSVIWTDPRVVERNTWRRRAADPDFYWAVLTYGIGHLWYVIVSTAGLALVGLGWAVRGLAVSPVPDRMPRLVVLSLSTSVLLASVLTNAANGSINGPLVEQADVFYYGRYGDPACVMLAICGLGVIAGTRSNRQAFHGLMASLVVLVVVSSITALCLAGRDLRDVFGPRVPGVWLLPFDRHHAVSILHATLVGGVLMAVVALAWRFRSVGLPIAGGVLLFLSALGTRSALTERADYDFSSLYKPVQALHPMPGFAIVAADIAFEKSSSLGVLAQQFFLVHDGWQFAASQYSSVELVKRGWPREYDLVVLLGHVDTARFADFVLVPTAFGYTLVLRPPERPL